MGPSKLQTGDLNIINSTYLRDVLAKEQKYCEPNSINWKLLMESDEDYARQ